MSTRDIVRSDEEIQAVVEWIDELRDRGGSHYRAMTYEQGMSAMLDWLTDNDADDPRE